MSLTREDLQHIEAIFDRKLQPIFGEIKALRNDIKEIYDMIVRLEERSATINEEFYSLPPKEQILQMHSALQVLAKKHGVALPQ